MRRRNPSPKPPAAAPTPDVTEAELSVLKALWRRGAATVRELTDDLYPGGSTSHYATVQKLLERLIRKHCVSRERRGRLFVFQAAIERGELITRRLQATADSLCEGSLTPLLTHLVDSVPLSQQELTALREMVESLDEASPRRSK